MRKKAILTKKAPLPIGPYNQAIQFDNLLFISGQIPLDPENGKLISSGIKEETNKVMINIQYILEEAKMNFNNVVKSSHHAFFKFAFFYYAQKTSILTNI